MLFNPFIWGDGGGEPETPTAIFSNILFSSLTPINDVIIGGTEDEPQSE